MAERWFFSEGGRGFGPFTADQLRQLERLGLLTPTDVVWQDGSGRSIAVADLERPGIAPPRPSPRPSRLLGLVAAAAGTVFLGFVWFFGTGRFSSHAVIAPSTPAATAASSTSRPSAESLPAAVVPVTSEPLPVGEPESEPKPKADHSPDEPRTGASSSTRDILPLVDLRRDVVQGRWVDEGGTFRCDGGGAIALPVEVPKHFELLLRVTRLKGRDAFRIGIVRDDIKAVAVLDNYEGSGLEHIDGKRRQDNGSLIRRKQFHHGRESEVVLRVDGESVIVTIDGQYAVNWRGDYRRLSTNTNRKDAPFGKICLMSDQESVHRISGIRLRPLSPR